MLAIDTSALASMVIGEQDARALNRCASEALEVHLSTSTAVEAFIVMHGRLGKVGVDRLEGIIAALDIRFRSVDTVQMRLAFEAYRIYGRGSGHRARLNFGDCFSYALAKSLDVPLLYKGEDFIHTDIRSALAA